jgi:hypothetical protein
VNAAADGFSTGEIMVNFSRFAVALAVLMPACAAFWAGLAVAAVPTRTPVSLNHASSAGVAPSLPEELDTMIPGTQMPFYLMNVRLLYLQRPLDAGCVSVDDPACDAPR